MTSAEQRAPWRVLVVDDNASLNWSLVNSLRRDGYQADGAATGEAALQYLTQARYECVISDVKMPGMDGFELLQWLRVHQPQTRVIMVTAFGSPSARQEALRGGVIAYLEKPFDLAALKAELRRLVSESGSGGAPTASDSYDLLELARVISLSRRDIALSVQGGGYTGTLRFLRGELVWADAGPLRGEVAFLALCTPRGGLARPVAWDGQAERNVTAPVSRLIYHALSAREGRPVGVSGTLSLVQPPADSTPASGAPATPPIAADNQPETSNDDASTHGVPDGPNASDVVADAEHSTATPAEGAGADTVTMETARMPAAAPALRPTPAPVRVAAASMTTPLPSVYTSSGPLAAVPLPPLDEATREAVHHLAQTLPDPCGVVLVRADGAVLCQSWSGRQEISAGAHSHLVGAAQAASRALLLADLGTLDDLRIRTHDHALLVRRVMRPEGLCFLVAIVPAAADLDATSAALALPGRNETAAHE